MSDRPEWKSGHDGGVATARPPGERRDLPGAAKARGLSWKRRAGGTLGACAGEVVPCPPPGERRSSPARGSNHGCEFTGRLLHRGACRRTAPALLRGSASARSRLLAGGDRLRVAAHEAPRFGAGTRLRIRPRSGSHDGAGAPDRRYRHLAQEPRARPRGNGRTTALLPGRDGRGPPRIPRSVLRCGCLHPERPVRIQGGSGSTVQRSGARDSTGRKGVLFELREVLLARSPRMVPDPGRARTGGGDRRRRDR